MRVLRPVSIALAWLYVTVSTMALFPVERDTDTRISRSVVKTVRRLPVRIRQPIRYVVERTCRLEGC